MTTRGVVGLLAALALAACAAAVLLARGCDDGTDDDAASRDAATADGAARVAVRKERRRARTAVTNPPPGTEPDVAASAPADDASDDAPPPNGDDVREVPIPGAPTGWAVLEVEVRDTDGAPSMLEQVHAVPAGDAADVSAWFGRPAVPSATTGRDGVARLRVPVPGTYQVRTSGRPWSLRSPAATVTGTARVTLRDVPRREIQVLLDDATPAGAKLDVSFQAVPGEVAVPGGAVAATETVTGGLVMSASRRSVTTQLPSAIEWTVIVPDGWRADPPSVRPPATVRVRQDDRAPLVLRCTLQPDATRARLDDDPSEYVRFASDAGDVSQARLDIPWLADAGEAGDEDGPRAAGTVERTPGCQSVTVAVRAPRGRIRWSGDTVVPGAADYDLDRADAVDVRILVPARPRTSDPPPRVRIDVDSPSAPATVDCVFVRLGANGDVDSIENDTLDVGAVTELEDTPEWLLVGPGRLGDLVARPLLIAPEMDARLEVGRGGFVRVEVAAPRPEGLDSVEVVRTDGAPFFAGTGRVEARLFLRTAKPAMARIGPFAPGVVLFDVLVGRVRWKRYEVTVRPGETTQLTVGPFGAR